ncbi:hypothetical protein K501DRAFT_271959 [Backusella circina FSU 941]|nr:hypothetical protein K501DRAFT_271959 [Backusella circina FSU 941]
MDEANEESSVSYFDESMFCSNDRKSALWLAEVENLIRTKSPKVSILVSEFQCSCNGTMCIQPWILRVFFRARAERGGWWTSEEVLQQLKEDAISLFENFHPECIGILIFDNSSNHQAYGIFAYGIFFSYGIFLRLSFRYA